MWLLTIVFVATINGISVTARYVDHTSHVSALACMAAAGEKYVQWPEVFIEVRCRQIGQPSND